MGCVNKNRPLKRAASGEKEELRAFVFLQECAAFAGRVYTEDNDHRYKNDGWQNSFHNSSMTMYPSYFTLLKNDLRNS
jgi:hypothetical protein